MNRDCTIFKTSNFIGKRWTLLILLELYKKDYKRYGELKENLLNITPKTLSSRLKELENQNLIEKKIDVSNFPIKCEYSLTESGKDFIKIIKKIKNWSIRWKFDDKLCQNLDCKNCNL